MFTLLKSPWHWRVVPFHQINKQTRVITLQLTNKDEIKCVAFLGRFRFNHRCYPKNRERHLTSKSI